MRNATGSISNEPCMKLAHRESLSGGLGTGKGLNSHQVTCITTSTSGSGSGDGSNSGSISKVASGWIDGSIRIFDVYSNDLPNTTTGSGTSTSTSSTSEIIQALYIHYSPRIMHAIAVRSFS